MGPVAPGSCRPGARPWLLLDWAAGCRVSIRGGRWREGERGRVCSAAGRLVLVPLENRIQLVTCRSSALQAACVYSLIRPPRTGFRRILPPFDVGHGGAGSV